MIPSDNCAIAACDEDSAFAFVQVPEWMEAWCAGPPLIAADVWHLLTDRIGDSVGDPFATYVAPLYRRLAMGSSHSVFLLMKMHLHSVGQTLLNYSRRLNQSPRQNDNDDISTVTDSSKPLYQQQTFELDDSHMLELNDISDEEWVARQSGLRAGAALPFNSGVMQCEKPSQDRPASLQSCTVSQGL